MVVEAAYEKNDKVFRMKLKIINDSDRIITINHNSGQVYDFILFDKDRKLIYTWSKGKMFAMALIKTVIEPEKSLEFGSGLNMERFGEIVNKAKYLKGFIVGTSKDATVNSKGYEIEIV